MDFPEPLWLSIGALLVKLMFRQSYWWYFVSVAAAITRRHHLTANSAILLALIVFAVPVMQCSLRALDGGNCFVDGSTEAGLCNSGF